MKYTIDGEFLGSFGKFGVGQGEFKNPYGIAIDSQERLWVVDTGNRRVQVFNTDGTFLSSVDSYNDGSGKFVHPKGIAIGPNQEVWIADPGDNAINVFPMSRAR